MEHKQILEHLTKDIGLLEKIFGKSSDILYDADYERLKIRLSEVYKKNDIDIVFPSRLDEQKLTSILDILFRVPQFGNEEQEERKKFLGIF